MTEQEKIEAPDLQKMQIGTLLTALRKVESHGRGSSVTSYYRNPEGPEAAAVIEGLMAEIHSEEKFLRAYPNAVSCGRWESVARLLSGQLREMDKRAKAANTRADATTRRVEALERALERLASGEAFDIPQAISGPLADEIIMRMDFAAQALKESRNG